MFCCKCGKEISDDVQYCPYCGQQVGNKVTNTTPQVIYVEKKEEPKSVFIALLLCFFLGLFGVHDFYLKRNGAAITKLLIIIFLGWCFIGIIINSFWCLLDFINILFRGYKALRPTPKKKDCYYLNK